MRSRTRQRDILEYIKLHPGTTLERMRVAFYSDINYVMKRLIKEGAIVHEMDHGDGRKKRWYVK